MAIRIVAVLVLLSSLCRAEEPAVLLDSVEARYSTESAKAEALIAKAEAEAARMRRAAAETRLKAYKDRLMDITKTGDFDKAAAVKARVDLLEAELEAEPPRRSINGVKILSATYGVNQSLFDVTDKLNAALSKRKEKDPLVVSDTLFGDPAPNYPTGNTLIVRYQKNGETHLVATYEGRPLLLR